jgi:predicted amidohydrolase YtcJ
VVIAKRVRKRWPFSLHAYDETISAILDVIEDVVMGHRPDCGR